MKKFVICAMLFATCLASAKNFHKYIVEVTNKDRPPKEPVGLYVVDFQVASRETGNYQLYTYRVYCPTKNVRDISGPKTWGTMRTAKEEDRVVFEKFPIMQEVVEDVCKGTEADTRRYKSSLPE